MSGFVSNWEDLPPGEWLPNDEHGVHWYKANDGTHWYSTEDGYRIWEEAPIERIAPAVQNHSRSMNQEFGQDYFSEYDFDEDDDDDDDGYMSGSFKRRKSPLATILIVLILIVGGGAAGYFIYGYFNKGPMDEFYGTTYWGYTDGELYGYLFEDKNSFDTINEPEYQEDGCDSDSEQYGNSDYLCIYDYAALFAEFDISYSLVEKSDHFEICMDEDCADFYPLERGLVINDGDECTVLVSDIGKPTFTYYDDGDIESYVLSESWKSKYQEIVDEIENDLPSSC